MWIVWMIVCMALTWGCFVGFLIKAMSTDKAAKKKEALEAGNE
jgi:uncharacterized membrane-anchored protein YhcB (DUF1043 family)